MDPILRNKLAHEAGICPNCWGKGHLLAGDEGDTIDCPPCDGSGLWSYFEALRTA